MLGLVTILLLSLITINSYNILKEFNNKNIEYINNYKQLQNKRNSFYDMLWNTFDTKSKISGISKNVFIDITKVIMDSRKDGINVTWKWLQENQNIDYNEYTKFYIDLSNYIEIKRTEMYQIDLEVSKLVLNQNNCFFYWFYSNKEQIIQTYTSSKFYYKIRVLFSPIRIQSGIFRI